MRYESKHSYFKKLTQSIGKFINLPYTLALRHQKLHCYYQMDENDYKVGNVDVGPGEYAYEELLSKNDDLPSKVSLTRFFEVLRC